MFQHSNNKKAPGMKFCSNCGGTVHQRVPQGDDRPRSICDHCDLVFYQNPRMIVGTLPVWGEKVLLCKRAISPRYGYWTLPAGFMENAETTLAGALRETWEEARAELANHELYRIFDLPHISQVYLFYRGDLTAEQFSPGPESLEVELFAEDEIPWDELAFPTIRSALQDYFEERRRGEFTMKVTVIEPMENL